MAAAVVAQIVFDGGHALHGGLAALDLAVQHAQGVGVAATLAVFAELVGLAFEDGLQGLFVGSAAFGAAQRVDL